MMDNKIRDDAVIVIWVEKGKKMEVDDFVILGLKSLNRIGETLSVEICRIF